MCVCVHAGACAGACVCEHACECVCGEHAQRGVCVGGCVWKAGIGQLCPFLSSPPTGFKEVA